MKVLVYCGVPFNLAHGGAQIQIQRTTEALIASGVEAEYLRWHDDRQRGDLIHVFGTISAGFIQLARTAGLPVALTSLLTDSCNYSVRRLRAQRLATRVVHAGLRKLGLAQQLHWGAFQQCAQNIVGLAAEKRVFETVHGIPAERVSVVPLGLSAAYLRAGAGRRAEPHLICTGTITPRKRQVELAELARAAGAPILFVGKPYAANDPYWLRFRALVDGRIVNHHPHVESEGEMIQLLQSARGFVILSKYENWCLSAHEAVACGLPILTPDQNWSRERFGGQAWYWPGLEPRANVRRLREFYDACPKLGPPQIELLGWDGVAARLRPVYETVLARWRGAATSP